MKVIKISIGLLGSLLLIYGLLLCLGGGWGHKQGLDGLAIGEFTYLLFGHRGVCF